MIGLVLVTHGRLAAEFVTAMEHVVGPQEAIEAICIGPDDDMEGPPQGHCQGDHEGRPGQGRDHPNRLVRRYPVEPRHQPDEGRECRGYRRREPADAHPPRRRPQGYAGPRRGRRRARGRPQIYFRRFRNPRGSSGLSAGQPRGSDLRTNAASTHGRAPNSSISRLRSAHRSRSRRTATRSAVPR